MKDKKTPKCWMPADSGNRWNIILPNPLPEGTYCKLERLVDSFDVVYPRIVNQESPLRARCAVETFAWYFKWNFGYDFVQYEANEKCDPKDFCLLWLGDAVNSFTIEHNKIPVGACCFRWRQWKGRQPSYGLAWIWLHPFARGKNWFYVGNKSENKSLLAVAWPHIRKKAPELAIEPPISDAMMAFLKSIGEEFETERSIFLNPKQ